MNIHSIALSIGALLCLSPAVTSADKYVSIATGADANPGTYALPYRTIQKGIVNALPGDHVYILGGEYRQEVKIQAGTGGTSANPIIVQPYDSNPVILKGSDLLDSGWVQHSTNVWKRTDILHRPQQVFYNFDNLNPQASSCLQLIGSADDGAITYTTWEYTPVAGNEATMPENSFYYVPSTPPVLYVRLPGGVSPNGRNVEVSTRQWMILSDRAYITFRDLYFRHSCTASYKRQGCAIEIGQGNIVEDCDIRWCDFGGVSLSWNLADSKVIGCFVSDNGALGVMAPGSPAFLIQNCTVLMNNYRNFQQDWHAGGIKATSNCYGTIENCEVGENNGTGIWFDDARTSQPKVTRYNYVHDNGPKEGGIMFEISKYGQIYNNVLVNNGHRAIYISASDEAQVYNNTVVNSMTRAGIEVDGVPRQGYTLTNNKVYNNIFYGDTGTFPTWDVYMRLNGSISGVSGNASNWNCFYRSSGTLKFTANGSTVYTTLSSWYSASTFEQNSISADPNFTVGLADDFSISSSSPVAETGTNTVSSILTTDYTLAPRQNTYDIGAYESVPGPAAENIYTTQVPTGVSSLAVEVGTKFKAIVSGSVTGVRIYTAATEATGVHQVRLWNSDGTLVSGPHDWSITGGTAGWKTFTLPAPVSLSANIYYIVSVTASPGTSSKYARTAAGFNAPMSNGNLRAEIGAGVYTLTAGVMPTTVENNSSYFRDVLFVPGGITESIFTTQVPTGASSLAPEVGTKFKAFVNGSITGVRIYTGAAEATGVHEVRLWNTNGTLVSGPHNWSITGGTAGWKTFQLPSAVSILANTYYIVSVTASPGTSNKYARTASGFNAPITNQDLRAEIGAGVYTMTVGAMPTTTELNSNYFRDVIFVP